MNGWMFPIQNQTELDSFNENPESGPLVIVLASNLFTPLVTTLFIIYLTSYLIFVFISTIVNNLIDIAKVHGVLVLPGEGPESK